MKYFRTQFIISTSLLALATIGIAARAQEPTPASPTNTPALGYVDPAPTGAPIVVARAQITGLSGPVVTVSHLEGKRRVYDPVILQDQTKIWLGKRQATTKNLRLRQYVRVAGFKDGDVITAERIDILTGSAKVPPPPKKPKPTVKPVQHIL